MRKLRINVCLAPQLVKKIDELAEAEKRSRSAMIGLLLEEAFEETSLPQVVKFFNKEV